jgi:hypothetical protein
MSNPLSVAMVTAALGQILGEALAGGAPGGVQSAGVSTLRPDMLAQADGDARGINVFLYQVAPNAAWAAAALPTRRPDGSLVARPQQALDLHYLLTFSGDESELEPQRMLGTAVAALCARPVLSRDLVRAVIAHAVEQDPTSWEQFSDLADQIDVVRFTMLPLSLEDLSKMWATFFQSPYRLSLSYQATVVLLDTDVTPQPALPVQRRSIDVFPIRQPSITRVVADTGPTDPVMPGSTLRIEGERLRGPFRTRVRLAGVEVLVAPERIDDTRLTVDLPPAVPAGVQGVQVLHSRMTGDPPEERDGAESNAAPVVVRPRVGAAVTAAPGAPAGVVDVTVPLDPPAGRLQRVVLSLNEHHPPDDRGARSYTFVAPPDPQGPATRPQVTVPVRGVEAGTYLVRIQVDGAQSILTPGGDGRYDEPRVTIP